MNISTHPNGFIQLGEGDKRFHIWSSDIKRQSVPTPIHNHRFTFRSKILYGTLIHIEYEIEQTRTGSHTKYIVDCREGAETKVTSTGIIVRPTIKQVSIFNKGDKYLFRKGLFHETRHIGFCVTEFEKLETDDKIVTTVLVPVGYEPENEFTRY